MDYEARAASIPEHVHIYSVFIFGQQTRSTWNSVWISDVKVLDRIAARMGVSVMNDVHTVSFIP